MFMAGQASAAQEVAAMSGDNRLGILAVVFLPVVGWVLFNIAGPALNQVNEMSDKNKSVIAGAGLGAALLSAGSAEASQEMMTMAGDNRLGILGILVLPVIGWVLFNIAGPALNQVNDMSEKNKSVIAGAGLGAALFSTGSAEASQEMMTMAGDNRLGILGILVLPVIGWVLFNIAGPALNQVNEMSEKSKSVVAGAGLGAALLSVGQADAAQELMTVAGDNRLGILGVLVLPVVGWVLFNIAGPALNQVNEMSEKNM